MSVDWGDWSAFEGAVGRPLAEVERSVARRYFDELMEAKADRIAALTRLLARNGAVLDTTQAGIQALNDFYVTNVEADRRDPERLAPRWFAVGLDVGLFIGDAIIERVPGVEWKLFTGSKRDLSHHRPVLMGFDVPNARYNVDPERVVGVHGRRIIAGDPVEPDQFWQMVSYRA